MFPVPRAPTKAADLLNHPLFLQSSPDSVTDPESSNILDALASLAYDGDPDETAATFKARADEAFRAGKTRDALGFYTQAISAGPSEPIRESLLANRAACHLGLQNYGAALRDAKECLLINIDNSKARYRLTRALFALGRFDDALAFCDSQPDQPEWRKLRADCQAGLDLQIAKEKRVVERENKQRELEAAVQDRGAIWKPSNEVPHTPQFIQREGTTPAALQFPVLLLYPAKHCTDLIALFDEDTTFADQLAVIFSSPPPWDAENSYRLDNISIYLPTHTKKAIKIGKALTLRIAMQKAKTQGGIGLLQNTINIVIVAKGKDETDWIEAFKKERGGS